MFGRVTPVPVFVWTKAGVEGEYEEEDYPAEEIIEIERRIVGGAFEAAGAAASEVKRVLKKLAVDPAKVRRAAIACFEAEINVIVYAREGTMKVRVSPRRIHAVVADRGPGIPDIEQAMQPGFTTASEEVREMGFGAGMGLPNIQQSVDYLIIKSEVGVGTELTFGIFLDRP